MKFYTKIRFIAFMSLVSSGLAAQVGIGTTNPEQDLHIAGANSTIRIDGLNAINNANNNGGIYTHNVEVNADGDLVVAETKVELLMDVTNQATELFLPTAANSGYINAEIYSRSFTLGRRALIFVEYTVSCIVLSFDGTCAVNDDRAKAIYNFYYLGDGTTADTSRAYGLESQFYTNSEDNTVTGYMFNNTSTRHILEAGTYSIHLQGAVFGGGVDGKAAFSGTFGNQETLRVFAYYF